MKAQPDILIVDEILAVGDEHFQNKCLEYMNKYILGRGASIIFVSHNRDIIFDLCQKCLYVNKGKIFLSGSTQEVMKRYTQDTESKVFS